MNALLSTPTPEQERPRIWVTLCVALGCFALGLLSVSALPRPTPQTPNSALAVNPASQVVAPKIARPEDSPSVKPTATPSPPPEPGANAAGESGVAQAVSQRAAIVASAEPSAVATPRMSTKTKGDRLDLRFIQGRVAYLRCDGLASHGDRFPCPRDVALETKVWDVLATMPKCAPSLGRGGTDVRLDLSRDQPTQVRVLAINGAPEPALDVDQVSACVSARLAKLKTTLDPLYMMVSFRASLR